MNETRCRMKRNQMLVAYLISKLICTVVGRLKLPRNASIFYMLYPYYIQFISPVSGKTVYQVRRLSCHKYVYKYLSYNAISSILLVRNMR